MASPVLGAFLAGAVVGSFLNVCSLRWPRGHSVVRPRSACPLCHSPLAFQDMIPVLSWLWLRGKCRQCAEPISPQYPLVELGTACMWGGTVVLYGVGTTALLTLVFFSILLSIALSDALFMRIPNPLSLGGAVLGVFLQMLPGGTGAFAAMMGAIGAASAMQGFRWLASQMMRREAMGGGDVRMMALIGAFVGFGGAMKTVFWGSALGLMVFAPRPAHRQAPVPFGLFLAVAAGLVWFVEHLPVS